MVSLRPSPLSPLPAPVRFLGPGRGGFDLTIFAGLLRVHENKECKECAEAGHVRALRYEGNSSASRLRIGARCVRKFKGSKERKECARIARMPLVCPEKKCGILECWNLCRKRWVLRGFEDSKIPLACGERVVESRK